MILLVIATVFRQRILHRYVLLWLVECDAKLLAPLWFARNNALAGEIPFFLLAKALLESLLCTFHVLSESVCYRLECLEVLVGLAIDFLPREEQLVHLLVKVFDALEYACFKLVSDCLNTDIRLGWTYLEIWSSFASSLSTGKPKVFSALSRVDLTLLVVWFFSTRQFGLEDMRLVMVVDMTEGIPAHVQPFRGRLWSDILLSMPQEDHVSIKGIQVVISALREDFHWIFGPHIILVHFKVALTDQCSESRRLLSVSDI